LSNKEGKSFTEIPQLVVEIAAVCSGLVATLISATRWSGRAPPLDLIILRQLRIADRKYRKDRDWAAEKILTSVNNRRARPAPRAPVQNMNIARPHALSAWYLSENKALRNFPS
jgi:hypothetical protein